MGSVTSSLAWQRTKVARMREQLDLATYALDTALEAVEGDEPVGETINRVWQTLDLDADTQLHLAKLGLMARIVAEKEEEFRTLQNLIPLTVDDGQTS